VAVVFAGLLLRGSGRKPGRSADAGLVLSVCQSGLAAESGRIVAILPQQSSHRKCPRKKFGGALLRPGKPGLSGQNSKRNLPQLPNVLPVLCQFAQGSVSVSFICRQENIGRPSFALASAEEDGAIRAP